MLELLSSPDAWLALITLTTLEVILGVDNLVMIAILVSALPQKHQPIARSLGIGFALLTRVMLLFTMSWLAGLVAPLFHIGSHGVSVRDLVLFVGGIFLIIKGFMELMELTHEAGGESKRHLGQNIPIVVVQIGFFDIIFSLDSVITAVAMSNQLPIMVTAIAIAMAVMLFASGPVIRIIDKHMSIKILALAFLLLIGVMLVLSSCHIELPKGYIYTAMAFSAAVEFFIIYINKKRTARGLKEEGNTQ